jgi:predicted ABC-type ATPase
VPELIVRRRFDWSIRNFLIHYRRLAYFWPLFDNSGATPWVVAFEKSEEVRIIDGALVRRYGRR